MGNWLTVHWNDGSVKSINSVFCKGPDSQPVDTRTFVPMAKEDFKNILFGIYFWRIHYTAFCEISKKETFSEKGTQLKWYFIFKSPQQW